MSNKYDAPPPQYPPQTHLDAGPYNAPPANQDYYGGNQQTQPYNQQGPPQQGYYGQQQPGYGPPQQQGMYYQQGPPPQGYYDDGRGRGSGGAGGGLCAGLLGAMACCCCLDFLF
ncbi:MAG: hypothetical protein Q9202_001664 [Teloschistes flavicans]